MFVLLLGMQACGFDNANQVKLVGLFTTRLSFQYIAFNLWCEIISLM